MKTVVATIVGIAVVLGLTVLGVKIMEARAPQAEKKETEVTVPLVKVEVVNRGDVEFSLKSEGVVAARLDTVLTAEVAGKLKYVDEDFESGVTYEKGDVIARIEAVDYQAAVAQVESTLADAELALDQEEARAKQAARDWEKIGGGKVASDLVLRLPFVKSAEAKVTAAIAALEKALADLERTKIVAPFDCRVRSVNLNVGATVGPGAQLGTIYDPNNLMIRLPFSLDDYAQLPEESKVTLSADIGGRSYQWKAEMMWEVGEIDQKTLSAFMLARVLGNEDHPARFALPSPGTFLNATVDGAVLRGVVGVPRSAVRGQNRVYVLGEDRRLKERELQVIRRTADRVFVTAGIEDKEEVILTKLDMPVVGMKLKVAGLEEKEEEANPPN
ncbi:MAG: efflux RND transporter periplasmic adaptor subunit [Akkermansiaceae bacterium]